jgi:hypothetical protein
LKVKSVKARKTIESPSAPNEKVRLLMPKVAEFKRRSMLELAKKRFYFFGPTNHFMKLYHGLGCP